MIATVTFGDLCIVFCIGLTTGAALASRVIYRLATKK